MKYDPTRPMTDQITSHVFHFTESPRDRNQFHALLQDLAITFGPALGWQRWPQDGQPLPSGYCGRGFYRKNGRTWEMVWPESEPITAMDIDRLTISFIDGQIHIVIHNEQTHKGET